jgi:hypothetical protein
MHSLFVLAVLTTAIPLASAQQSLFQSADGQTAIYLRQSTASINLGDSKASLAYIHRVNIQPFSWGVEGYATANTGVASLFLSDRPKAPEGGGDGTLVRHYLFTKMPEAGESGPAREDSLILDVGYGRSSFYLYPTGVAASTSAPKTNFDRLRAVVAYNFFASGNKILGIAGGAERRNNLSDLKSTSLQTVIVAAPPGSQSSIVKTQAGYYGDYKKYIAAPIYTDFLFYLPEKIVVPGFDNRIGIDFLSRSDIASANRSSQGGIGIFLFKKADPLASIGGLSATYDGTSFQVSLTAGLTF